MNCILHIGGGCVENKYFRAAKNLFKKIKQKNLQAPFYVIIILRYPKNKCIYI